MRKRLRTTSQKSAVKPLRYARHASYGARVFFNDTGYQAHTVVCWFERNKEFRDRWVFRTRRRGADMPPEEFNRHYFRAFVFLKRNGLNPDTATYSDIVELAKSFEGRPRRSEKQVPALAD